MNCDLHKHVKKLEKSKASANKRWQLIDRDAFKILSSCFGDYIKTSWGIQRHRVRIIYKQIKGTCLCNYSRTDIKIPKKDENYFLTFLGVGSHIVAFKFVREVDSVDLK